MAQKKSVISLFFFLLLLFVGNSQAFHYAIPGRVVSIDASQYAPVQSVSASGTTINYHAVNKDWRKIRYLGGEYHYSIPFISLVNAYNVVTCCSPQTRYTSFISSKHPFLFKLRGPPYAC